MSLTRPILVTLLIMFSIQENLHIYCWRSPILPQVAVWTILCKRTSKNEQYFHKLSLLKKKCFSEIRVTEYIVHHNLGL